MKKIKKIQISMLQLFLQFKRVKLLQIWTFLVDAVNQTTKHPSLL